MEKEASQSQFPTNIRTSGIPDLTAAESHALSVPFSKPSSLRYSLSRELYKNQSHSRSQFSRFKTKAVQISIPLEEPGTPPVKSTGVVIIGAGLAGLAAATRLSTVCLNISADRAPVLFLNGSGNGIVNNVFSRPMWLCPMVRRKDFGIGLVSISGIGMYKGVSDEDLTAGLIRELLCRFGNSTMESWKHLRTYQSHMEAFKNVSSHNRTKAHPQIRRKNPKIGSGVYVCGDHRTSATFDGGFGFRKKRIRSFTED